jgi:hypothetical protein
MLSYYSTQISFSSANTTIILPSSNVLNTNCISGPAHHRRILEIVLVYGTTFRLPVCLCSSLNSMLTPTMYVDDETPFNADEWIGKGKKYSEVPYFVHLARKNAQAIPADIIQQLPARNMAIPQFLKETLPQQSKEFNFHAPSTWFRNEEPTRITVEEIFEMVWRRRSIPPQDILTKLQEEFCQRWLDGSKSMVDPRFNHGHEKLPFWVLSLWIHGSKIRRKQEDWREAYTRVVEETQNPVIAAEFPNAQCFFGVRGWDADIKDNGNELTTHAVAQLLCRRQLFCEVTELMVENLQQRLAAMGTKHPHHIIASSRLYTIFDLERTKFCQKDSLPKTLKQLVDQVDMDPQLVLWLPVLHSNHQVVIQVDFGKRVISYGMWFQLRQHKTRQESFELTA